MDIGFRSLRDIGYWIPKASRYWILDSESLQILDIDNTITRRSTQYQNGIVLIRTVLRLGCGFGESKLWRSRSIVASVLWDFCLMCLATKFLAQPLLPEVLWLRKASLTVPGNLPGKASTWHGQTHSRSSQTEFPGTRLGFHRLSCGQQSSDAHFRCPIQPSRCPRDSKGSSACPAIAAAAGDEHTLLLGLCIAHNSFDSFWLVQEPSS